MSGPSPLKVRLGSLPSISLFFTLLTLPIFPTAGPFLRPTILLVDGFSHIFSSLLPAIRAKSSALHRISLLKRAPQKWCPKSFQSGSISCPLLFEGLWFFDAGGRLPNFLVATSVLDSDLFTHGVILQGGRKIASRLDFYATSPGCC
ncbi:hypothetical protein B0J14DRAFT_589786 [Halenospora varia]|nr:hypothetical protein B0J14DRAFT_589786 [Halenospora varia]